MQLNEIILYNHAGETRSLRFKPGALNVITGDSLTGKSTMLGIIRFLLGSDTPHVARGPIQNTVAWYGLLASAGGSDFFVGRPAPAPGSTTSETMLVVGIDVAPALQALEPSVSADNLRSYLGGLIGIEDNINVPSEGQTRRPLAATFVHSLHYCFQGQGEIANPEILFHRQNRGWIPQTIKDTFPYFMGTQGLSELRKREELNQARRELRRAVVLLNRFEANEEAGLGQAAGLISEARSAGLLSPSQEMPGNIADALILLRQASSTGSMEGADPSYLDSEFLTLREARQEILDELRQIHGHLAHLDDYAKVDSSYAIELREQEARLASVQLLPLKLAESTCPLCSQTLSSDGGARSEIENTLGELSRRLSSVNRDRPRIQQARDVVLERRRGLSERLNDINQSIESLANQHDLVADQRRQLELGSYVRGRLSFFVDSYAADQDGARTALQAHESECRELVAVLEGEIDAQGIRSRTNAKLIAVGRLLTNWARSLGLEHSEHGARIDMDRLTIVADTPSGPAYMDEGEIGSGFNWVGYHISAYLALQQHFIDESRPVPRFVVLDQPSQAFFPRDRESGGDLSELSDTDRQRTHSIFDALQRAITQSNGALQILVLDHAEFQDAWFQDAIVERWREGAALIPSSWVEAYGARS